MSKKTHKKTGSKTTRMKAPKSPAGKKSPKIAGPSRAATKVASKTKAAAKKPKPAGAQKPAAKTAGNRGAALPVGMPAPDFDLLRDGGKRISLADRAGRKLVIFFYPRADTPGCTREAIDFTRLKADFEACGTAVFGVSGDPVKSQDSFRNKHQLAIPLISDEGHQMLLAYGAWGEKSMYGRTFEGVLRTTVLIDSNGLVARIWRSVKVDGHADEVLSAARAL
jgi:peroxiredoxin Q/BCP